MLAGLAQPEAQALGQVLDQLAPEQPVLLVRLEGLYRPVPAKLQDHSLGRLRGLLGRAASRAQE